MGVPTWIQEPVRDGLRDRAGVTDQTGMEVGE